MFFGVAPMILSSQSLRGLIEGRKPMIEADYLPIQQSQIQAASLDLRLGNHAFLMKAAGLPAPSETVKEYIDKCGYCVLGFQNTLDFILPPGQCWIVPLVERLSLSPDHYATFSPKSSVGRSGVFVRVLTDNNTSYDRTPRGYSGPMYLEILSLLSFPVKIAMGTSLVQMRVVEGEEKFVSAAELHHLHARHGILFGRDGNALSWKQFKTKGDGLLFHIDLARDIVGFQAKSTAPKAFCLYERGNRPDVEEFWSPIHRPEDKQFILPRGKFTLLTTKEFVKIPDECCAEVKAYDLNLGEFRTHFAGFFDNGFGGENGTAVVLELFLTSTDFRFFDGQVICSFVFQKTDHVPDKLYGVSSGSNYTKREPSLSKFFKGKDEVWK